MLKKEYQIIKPFIEKPWKKFTFKQIKEYSNKKSESYTYNSLKKFVKENILKEENVGNSILYSINIDSDKSFAFLGFISEFISWNNKHIPYSNINELYKKIPKCFFIFIITGSYAKNKQKATSDLDVVIICDNSNEPKKIYAELNFIAELSIPQIHLYVFRESEFLEMLLTDEENYGKEIARNNLILTGGEHYFRILSEAIENGFKG
jgi:predicted nucleotidyltransferase